MAILELTKQNLVELNISEDDIEKFLTWDNHECNYGNIFASNVDKKIYTERDYYTHTYNENSKPIFPFGCLDLISKYYWICLKKHLDQRKALLGSSFVEQAEKEEFKRKEITEAEAVISHYSNLLKNRPESFQKHSVVIGKQAYKIWLENEKGSEVIQLINEHLNLIDQGSFELKKYIVELGKPENNTPEKLVAIIKCIQIFSDYIFLFTDTLSDVFYKVNGVKNEDWDFQVREVKKQIVEFLSISTKEHLPPIEALNCLIEMISRMNEKEVLYEIEERLPIRWEQTIKKHLIYLEEYQRKNIQGKIAALKLSIDQQSNNEVLPPQPAKTKIDKLKGELGEYGFFELSKVKQLSEPHKHNLVELVNKNALPYCIAMFEHLGFLKHLKAEHFTTDYKLFKEVAKWFEVTERAVKGNVYVLNKISKENRTRYTADQQKQTVQKDYGKLK